MGEGRRKRGKGEGELEGGEARGKMLLSVWMGVKVIAFAKLEK